MSFGFCLMSPFYSLNFALIISGSLISQKLLSTLVISIMAHLYSFNDFHILFGNYNLTLVLIQIPGSIIYNFIYNFRKYYNVTLGARICPYSSMYYTISQDGALQAV